MNQIIPAALPANKATNWPGVYPGQSGWPKDPDHHGYPSNSKGVKIDRCASPGFDAADNTTRRWGQTDGWENLGDDQNYARGGEEPRQQRVGDVDDEPSQSGQAEGYQKNTRYERSCKASRQPVLGYHRREDNRNKDVRA